uniref:Uncharacterized protein n=1 Tax=Avena sativa TaxID=4498 RepID=A0ACD5VXY3_AVESA
MPPQPQVAMSARLPAGSALGEVVATAAASPKPAAVLAAAALTRRRSDPAIGGKMCRACRFRKSGMVHPTASRPFDEMLRDPAVMVEGLGSLSLLPDDFGGPISAEIPLPVGAALSTMNPLWDASLSSDEDNNDEALVPRTPSSSVTCSVHCTANVTAPAEPSDGLSAATAALGVEEGWVHVGRGGRPCREPSPLLHKAGLERSVAFKRWAQGRCFRCLERDHQVSTCREPFRCIRCRRPGHRERFCRARFPAALGDEVVTRAPSPVARAPCQQSCSPFAQPRRPSSPRSWAEIVGHSSVIDVVPPSPSTSCCEQFKVNAALDSLFQSQVTLMRMELLQLVDVRIEEVCRPLREEVAALKLLVRGAGSLEPMEACPFDGLVHAGAQDSTVLDSSEKKSSVVKEEQLYSCFSPRGPLSQPVVSVASECEGMRLIMAEELDFEESRDVDAAVPLSPESGRLMVSTGDGAAKSGVVTPVPGAVVAREICDFLATLVAAYPGTDKSIGCKVKSMRGGARPRSFFGKKKSSKRGVLQELHL